MPVFDFNATPDEKKPAECTYTVIRSNENEATIEKPMMILDNKQCKWEHQFLRRIYQSDQEDIIRISAGRRSRKCRHLKDRCKICKSVKMARRESY